VRVWATIVPVRSMAAGRSFTARTSLPRRAGRASLRDLVIAT
jgi:hypothetical protein